ncbi:hypothetical protein R50073_31170 [Maricurvus nonylphenolicus]|uniref:substrate-binding periplasmic protein n=1 Tax=Maricurvus nonylphenolicus TaxID=1008307 RepID=UPI0036F32C2F
MTLSENRSTVKLRLIRLVYIIYSCLMLFSISSNASTAINNSQITHITAAVYNAPPWGWKAPNGQIKGIGAELVRDLVREIDPTIEVKFVLGATERMIQLVLTGQVDILMTFYDERLAEKAIHLKQGISYEYQVWSLSKTPLNSEKDLNNLRLATSQSYKDILNLNVKSTNYVSTTKKLIPILLSGHVDVVAALSHSLEFNASKLGFTKNDFNRLTVRSFETHTWISKKSQINTELQRWKDASIKTLTDESYNQLIQELFQKEAKPSNNTAQSET